MTEQEYKGNRALAEYMGYTVENDSKFMAPLVQIVARNPYGTVIMIESIGKTYNGNRQKINALWSHLSESEFPYHSDANLLNGVIQKILKENTGFRLIASGDFVWITTESGLVNIAINGNPEYTYYQRLFPVVVAAIDFLKRKS